MNLNYETKIEKAKESGLAAPIKGTASEYNVRMQFTTEDLSSIAAANMRCYFHWKKQSYNHFSNYLLTECRIDLDYSNWTKYLNIGNTRTSKRKKSEDENKRVMPIGIIAAFSEYSGLAINDLLTEGYVRDLSDTTENQSRKPPLDNSSLDFVNEFLNSFIAENRRFIYRLSETGWYSWMLKQFIDNHEYYLYYLSIMENKRDTVIEETDYLSAIRTGKLYFTEKDGMCGVTMTLDYRSVVEPEVSYNGFVIISELRQCAYCIFQGNHIKPELSFLMFRLRCNEKAVRPLDCRICLSLTTDPERSRPTCHRLLIVRKPLAYEHLNLVTPHLRMNFAHLTLHEDVVLSLLNDCGKDFDEWKAERRKNKSIAKNGGKDVPSRSFILKEDELFELIKGADNPNEIFATLKQKSPSITYGKISSTVDGNLWKLLKELGYYNAE